MKFTKADFISLLKGLGVALVGAFLTYMSQWIAGYNFGAYTPVVTVAWGVVVNYIRKLIDAPIEKATGVSL